MRQTEGLIGSIIRLLGLGLPVPDYSTLSRQAETLHVPRPRPSSSAEPLHLLVDSPVASFIGDGAYDRAGVYRAVANHQPEAAIIVPPRMTAVFSSMAAKEPAQRDRHLQDIAEKGCSGWQRVSGYTRRSRGEATIGRLKQVIGDGLRSRNDQRWTTEVSVAIFFLNRMLKFERSTSVRVV